MSPWPGAHSSCPLPVGRPAHTRSRLHTLAEQGEWGLLPSLALSILTPAPKQIFPRLVSCLKFWHPPVLCGQVRPGCPVPVGFSACGTAPSLQLSVLREPVELHFLPLRGLKDLSSSLFPAGFISSSSHMETGSGEQVTLKRIHEVHVSSQPRGIL